MRCATGVTSKSDLRRQIDLGKMSIREYTPLIVMGNYEGFFLILPSAGPNGILAGRLIQAFHRGSLQGRSSTRFLILRHIDLMFSQQLVESLPIIL